MKLLFVSSKLRTAKYSFIRFFHEKIVFKLASKDQVFSSIYKSNYWGDSESRSGPGSSLEYTKNIRSELPVLFSKFDIKKVFDAPCGDYVWMKLVVEETKIDYTGVDIVKSLIEKNNVYSSNHVHFYCADITVDKFPSADLWICRDAFFHLSMRDIVQALILFSESEIKFVLTSTHKNISNFSNEDIASGDFRLIDLFSPPFCFPANPFARFDDYIHPHPPREMCLFSKEQVLKILQNIRKLVAL